MVHGVVSLGFGLVALASAALIWMMLHDYRVAILSALGVAPAVAAPRMSARRLRVRSVQPVSARAATLRRAA